ncbi:MAG: hypothetical protein AAF465_05195 [Pseudomonadota bacterium]
MAIRHTLCALLLMMGVSSHAALTLEFTTPSGTAGANDAIEIWLTLSTDTGFSFDPFDPDGDMSYGGAIDPSDVPNEGFSFDANMGTGGFVEFDFIEFVGLSLFATCNGSFVVEDGTCGFGMGGTDNYSFSFGPGPSPGNDPISLAAGESLDFLFGTFTPVAGGAEAGTYDFFRVGLSLFFAGVGFDDLGEEVAVDAFFDLALACEDGDPSCAFTRTVSATPVPVPAAAWLFASALLALSSLSRRRHR